MEKENQKQPILFSGTLFVVLGIIVLVLGSKQRQENGGIPTYTVTVQSADYVGQGVIYAKNEEVYYVVTTAHLMDGTEMGQYCNVTLHDGTQTEALLFYCSDVVDVAFLMLQTDKELVAVPKDRAGFDSLASGDVIWAYSLEENTYMQTEGQVLSTWVYLEDFSVDMMLAKLDGRAGMSGCAILDASGCFVGILCGVSEAGEAAVLPFSVIESEWIMTGREKDS